MTLLGRRLFLCLFVLVFIGIAAVQLHASQSLAWR